MTNEQQHHIYFNKAGRPLRIQPDDLFEWVAERAAEAVCYRLGRNTVEAHDIHAQFDVPRSLWGFSPAFAVSYIANEYYNMIEESRL